MSPIFSSTLTDASIALRTDVQFMVVVNPNSGM